MNGQRWVLDSNEGSFCGKLDTLDRPQSPHEHLLLLDDFLPCGISCNTLSHSLLLLCILCTNYDWYKCCCLFILSQSTCLCLSLQLLNKERTQYSCSVHKNIELHYTLSQYIQQTWAFITSKITQCECSICHEGIRGKVENVSTKTGERHNWLWGRVSGLSW